MGVKPETRLRAARYNMYCNRQFMGDIVSRFDLVDVGHDVERVAADEYGNLYFNSELDGKSYGSAQHLVSMLSKVVTEVALNDAEFASAYRTQDDVEVWEAEPTGTPREMVEAAGSIPKDWEAAVAEANSLHSVNTAAAHECVEQDNVDGIDVASFSEARPVLEGMAKNYYEESIEVGTILSIADTLHLEYAAYLLRESKKRMGEEFADAIKGSQVGEKLDLLYVVDFSKSEPRG